ncbi:unnamed protein product [Lymnaea stagnalis]|uniref:RRM domain-containing protein n=1 Tax=Lymnaea stagnalis TaxID=6523 RepID=A0AAV2HJM7_LYMST
MAATTRRKRKSAKNGNAQKIEITEEDRLPGVVYIGHVPHGFFEKELFQYFSQFGKVLKVKLSRSSKSGKSKGYAFIKFKYSAVAKTVADTCHNYLFFSKLLKCEYKSMSEVHANTFYTYKWKPNSKAKRLHNTAKPEVNLVRSLRRSTRKQAQKLAKLNVKLEDVMDVPVIKEK